MVLICQLMQVKARPPSFAAFVSGSKPVSEDAVRYLASELRRSLGFEGVPVRIWFRLKEARTAKFREANSRRGRPLAMRGGNVGRLVRAATARLRTSGEDGGSLGSFKAAAHGILDGLSQAKRKGPGRESSLLGLKGSTGSLPWEEPEADEAESSKHGRSFGVSVSPKTASSNGTKPNIARRKPLGGRKMSLPGPASLSKAQVMARLLMANKPSAAPFHQHAMAPGARKSSRKRVDK